MYFCQCMYSRLPYLFRFLLPGLIWKIKSSKNEVFLSFDDGPHPEITPRVLEVLNQYNAKATFFCVGQNVEKYPDVYNKILEEGHLTGNHTFNHVNGWKVSSKEYYKNIEMCSDLVDSQFFRPPYGRIKLSHIPYVKMQYRIIMWSVLSGDYDLKMNPRWCLERSIRYTKSGSIIVFHDSKKAASNMLYALPRFLDHFSNLGYRFPVIPH